MVTFPPATWEIRNLADMDPMEGTPLDDSDFSFQLLLAVPPADGREGFFKFLLSGKDHLMLEVPVVSILNDDRFRGLTINTQLQLGTQVPILT